jgi:hypothetical protein
MCKKVQAGRYRNVVNKIGGITLEKQVFSTHNTKKHIIYLVDGINEER